MGDLLKPTNDEQDHQKETSMQQYSAANDTVDNLQSTDNMQELTSIWVRMIESNQLNQAIIHFTNILEKDCNNTLVLSYLSIALAKKGDYKTAIDIINRQIQLEPTKAIPYYNKGNFLYLLWDYENAVTQYTAALKRDYSITQAIENKATALHKLERRTEARELISDDHSYFHDELLVDLDNTRCYSFTTLN